MQRKRQAIVVAGATAGTLETAAARLQLVGPNLGTFLALGVLATLSVMGIGFGLWLYGRPAGREKLIGN